MLETTGQTPFRAIISAWVVYLVVAQSHMSALRYFPEAVTREKPIRKPQLSNLMSYSLKYKSTQIGVDFLEGFLYN